MYAVRNFGNLLQNESLFRCRIKFISSFSFLPAANEVWGKVIFLHLSVILFTWGGSAPLHAGIHPHPQDQRQVPPGDQRQVSHLTRGRYCPRPEAGIRPSAMYSGRYGQQAGGTHPTEMQSC